MLNMASLVLGVGTEPRQLIKTKMEHLLQVPVHAAVPVSNWVCWCRRFSNRSCNAEKSCFPHIFPAETGNDYTEHKPLLLSSHDRCVTLSPHRDHGNQAEQNNIQPGWTVSSSSLSGNQAFYSLVHDDLSGETIIVNAQFYPKSCTGWSFL